MQRPNNTILVIFGASGDLTFRKLIPALFALHIKALLPERFAVLGTGRTKMSTEEFRVKMKEALQKFSPEYEEYKSIVDPFISMLNYLAMETSNVADYAMLGDALKELDTKVNSGGNYIYYLSTPPSLYEIIPRHLKAHKLNVTESGSGHKRLIVEKPFGYDLTSAQNLNKNLLDCFAEDQIYRIDHYLGKETVQNIFVTRFANGIFEPLWNRNFVDHVEITSAEEIGIEDRGGYYDTSGALRDMVQNHLLQLTGLLTMEPPAGVDATSIRNEVNQLVSAMRIIPEQEVKDFVVRGQYDGGTFQGNTVKRYLDEKGIPANSKTETYVAIKFFIDNWRWSGVPFYIRTGKRMPTKVTEAVIHFKSVPHILFKEVQGYNSPNNQLVIRIQPDEGILLKIGMKVPGAGFMVQMGNMDFHYTDLNHVMLPTAYERLLLDCMNGDATLYSRGDTVEAAWKFVQPILDAWKNDPSIPVHQYQSGSWGPEAADALFKGTSGVWRYPCRNLSDDGKVCEL